VQTRIPYWSGLTSARLDCSGGLNDAQVPVWGCFIQHAPTEIPVCWLKGSPSEGRSSGGREWREGVISTIFIIFILLLLIISLGFGLGGSFLQTHHHGYLGSTPKPPPLPPCLLPFNVGTIGLRHCDPLWGIVHEPKIQHKNAYVLMKQKLTQADENKLKHTLQGLTSTSLKGTELGLEF
jgi:hypothetical protein